MIEFTFNDFAQLATARSGVYRFLATIFIEKPTREFVENLQRGTLVQNLVIQKGSVDLPPDYHEGVKTIESFSRKIKDTELEDSLQDIVSEWTRLFRGIRSGYGPPPPYESVYEDGGRLMGDSVPRIIKAYSKQMVQVSKAFGEPPDHISVELDFMRLLCQREAEAWRKNDYQNAVEQMKLERDFLSKHPAKWFPKFCKKVAGESGSGIFKGLTLITNVLLSWDIENIEAILQTASHLGDVDRA